MKSAQQNWTANVSEYLIKRRKQTAQAYQSQLLTEMPVNSVSVSSMSINAKPFNSISDTLASPADNLNALNRPSNLFNQFADILFQSLFIVIGQELEQGHTVIRLDEKQDWQSQVLEMLLIDWMEVLDNPLKLMMDVLTPQFQAIGSSTLNFNQSLFDQALQNSTLDRSVQKILKQRLHLAYGLYCFFNQFQHQVDNQLEAFANALTELPLFVEKRRLINNPDDNGRHTQSNQGNNQYTTQHNNQHAPIVVAFSDGQLTLWLHRSWQAEQSIADNIQRLIQANPQPLDLSNINHNTLKAEQLVAIKTANNSAFSIITGGPGTGKTYTVAQLVIALHHVNKQRVNQQRHNKQGIDKQGIDKQDIDKHPNHEVEKPLSLVLTAPTGKASQRMQESLQSALDFAGVTMNLQEAKTIHRLLGIGQAGVPRYNKSMPLSEDVIIVDEASMLGVELANYLLNAVKTGARLILLGDAHQLSAVDAGAVLADLCQIQTLQSVHANLSESTRFTADSAVGQLATLINTEIEINSDDDRPHQNLKDKLTHLFSTHTELTLYGIDQQHQGINQAQIYRQLRDDYQPYFKKTRELYRLYDKTLDKNLNLDTLSDLMALFNQFRILTSGHNGIYGDDKINEALTQYHRQLLKLPLSTSEWYHGRPVMVRKNNYRLTLFNGDIGLCVQTDEGLAVYFEGKDKPIAVNMLGNLEVGTAYAMTVHKSQGSEFDHVAIMLGVLDDKLALGGVSNTLLNREMIYTAITRAKKEVSIYSTLETLQKAVANPTIRQTGLALSF